MILQLTADFANQIGAVCDAASTDAGRPILNAVCFEMEQKDPKAGVWTLTVTATDTYSLATRAIDLAGDAVLSEPTHTEPVLIPAKQLKKAIKDSIVKNFPMLVELNDEGITVTSVTADAPEFTIKPVVGTFPKWRSLMPDKPYRDVTSQLPAFNGEYLANVAKFISMKPSERSKHPLIMGASAPEKAELKAWIFQATPESNSRLTVLLMPTRV